MALLPMILLHIAHDPSVGIVPRRPPPAGKRGSSRLSLGHRVVHAGRGARTMHLTVLALEAGDNSP